jgi:integrase
MSFSARLQQILHRHNSTSADGRKVVSFATKALRAQVLRQSFRELRQLGFRLQNPENLKPKHAQALVSSWEGKKLAPATIGNRVSVLRTFCDWINKPGMILPAIAYVSDPAAAKRQVSATQSKAWETNGVDSDQLVDQVMQYDKWVGMQLKVMQTFGLRRKEAVCLRPYLADQVTYLAVSHGTKGGRDRVVPIDSDQKRAIMEEAKRLVGGKKDTPLARPGKNLKQNLRRFNYVVEKFGITKKDLGVTGHGLRHGCLNGLFFDLTGAPAPVEGGRREEVTPEDERLARMKIAEVAGHSRPSVTTAYSGSYRQMQRIRRKEEAKPDGPDESPATPTESESEP